MSSRAVKPWNLLVVGSAPAEIVRRSHKRAESATYSPRRWGVNACTVSTHAPRNGAGGLKQRRQDALAQLVGRDARGRAEDVHCCHGLAIRADDRRRDAAQADLELLIRERPT